MSEESNIAASYQDEAIIKDLAPLLNHSAYACGGAVAVKAPTQASKEGVTSPVTIRWDSTDQIEKIVLPTTDPSLVQRLIKSTQPASFGLKGEEVIDESYRKASKLDPSAFSTTFCPCEVGIIEILGQILLPLLQTKSQGIRAELYKLNVYKDPSGLFKPHLDTPRSDLHFGTLVVCLPSVHVGGQVLVRHQDHTTTFNWSGDSSNIQWAAFYSDCEHEVSQVTSGHRIILTYNLFLRRGLGEMAGSSSTLNITQLLVHKEVKAALVNSQFFPEGGLLGNYCSHAYAHATKEGIRALPAVLKGSDMVTYETFESLGMRVDIRPELEIDSSKWYYDSEDEDRLFGSHRISVTLTPTTGTSMGENCGFEEIFAGFRHKKLRVKWLNSPIHENKNLQYNWIAYGNQAELDCTYSLCVLLVMIPSFTERMKILEMLDRPN
ncbi:hypothetical protein G6514_009455 [Epicoccum nigrum]|nr:hypothetical protein G6514_009455 [Epicoccum nigrum]